MAHCTNANLTPPTDLPEELVAIWRAQQSTEVLPTGWRGSTFLNSSITSYSDLAYRIKTKLGYPRINIEISDEQLAAFIDEALEFFTKYSGFTEEYLIFSAADYVAGCGLKLDRYVNYGGCGTPACIESVSAVEVTSITVSTIELGTYDALLTAYNTTEALDPWNIPVVSTESPVYSGHGCIIYDSANPWDFGVCDATSISISARTPATDDVELCGPVAGWFTAVDGLVTIYSFSAAAFDADGCIAASAYWGCDISDADHVIIEGVPACTIGGRQGICSNDGKTVSFQDCNTDLSIAIPMSATFTFVQSVQPADALLGEYAVNSNNGMQLCFDYDSCVPCSPTWMEVQVTFLSSVSTNNYGITVTEMSGHGDFELREQRKIVDVFSIDRGGTFGFGGDGANVLFGIDYMLSQSLFGGTSISRNLQTQGFDFVTYELLAQYVELSRRMLARDIQYRFNRDTQMVKFIPEPTSSNYRNFYGILGLYIEKPIAHLLKEKWVQNYALALTMISLGHIRGKFGNVPLFGGGSINATDVMTQGLDLKQRLEEQIVGTTFENPTTFFVG